MKKNIIAFILGMTLALSACGGSDKSNEASEILAEKLLEAIADKVNEEEELNQESAEEGKDASVNNSNGKNENDSEDNKSGKVYSEQVKKLVFPDGFESWDFPAKEIVGTERTFYADGHLVNMPNYIGEWEELLGVKFVEIPLCYAGGSSNYEYNNICVYDENRVEYIFKINTESYEKKENIEEELEQLRKTETVGFEMRYDPEGWEKNMSMRDYISLLPDKNIFTADIETVNEQLIEQYGVELETTETGYHFYADKFDKGFMLDWECSEDGTSRHLTVEYAPNPHLAYYKFINGEIKGEYKETEMNFSLEDIAYRENIDELLFKLFDVSNDGIDEMIISTLNGIVGVYYEKDTGKLRNFAVNDSEEMITNYGVIKGCGYLFEDGSYDHYYEDDAIYVVMHYYLVGENGLEELATIEKCIRHGDYYINGKRATKEQVSECELIYGTTYVGCDSLKLDDCMERIKNDSKLIYSAIRRHKQDMKERPIMPYDDSELEEITFDESKRTIIDLLLKMMNNEIYLCDFLEAGYWNSTSAFALIDFDGDGEQELLTSLGSNDGIMHYATIYAKNREGNYESVGSMSKYNPETGEIVYEYGSAFAALNVFTFDGQQLNKVESISSGENMEGPAYTKEFHPDEVEISEEEFDHLWYTYTHNAKPIKGQLMTLENIEEALGVKICGNGKIISDK